MTGNAHARPAIPARRLPVVDTTGPLPTFDGRLLTDHAYVEMLAMQDAMLRDLAANPPDARTDATRLDGVVALQAEMNRRNVGPQLREYLRRLEPAYQAWEARVRNRAEPPA